MTTSAISSSSLSGASIVDRIRALAEFTEEPGRMTRLYLSPPFREAADCVAQWMREAGMSVQFDAAANVIGRYDGATKDARTLILGSHIDTVRNAGIYDGPLGVIAAIAIVQELSRTGRRLPFAIEVAAFSDEEGVRFPTTLTGSKAITGHFDESCLDERDANGLVRRDLLAAMGCRMAEMPACARDPATILGYVEMHIEQGPVLEARDLPVGIVSAINGVTRGEVLVQGFAGHAGTLPMDMRRDALVAASEMVLAVEARARREAGLVATVGTLSTLGGAVNVVPGRVQFSLDIRSPSDAVRLRAVDDICAEIQAIAALRDVTATTTLRYAAEATPCDAGLRARLASSIARHGIKPFELVSGAGHDAMAFGGIWPTSMLFVRCLKGVSHNPAEYASPEDIEIATRIMFDLVTSFGEAA